MTDIMEVTKGSDNTTITKIRQYVSENTRIDHIPQPLFVMGEYGTGKSTLLKKLVSELGENRGYDVRLYDGRQFFASTDIISAIEKSEDTGIVMEKSPVRPIVLIDDIDYYLKRSSFEDQYLLRNYLNSDFSPLLVASISAIDKSLSDYNAPFFEGVRILYIPAFETNDISVENLTQETKNRIEALMEFLPPVVGSFKMASEIVSLSSNRDADINALIERFDHIYRTKFESLPAYSQKILYSIANSDGAVELSKLRTLTDLPAGILSPYLRQLVKEGCLRKMSTKKRNVPYAINDKLFKLWLSTMR